MTKNGTNGHRMVQDGKQRWASTEERRGPADKVQRFGTVGEDNERSRMRSVLAGQEWDVVDVS